MSSLINHSNFAHRSSRLDSEGRTHFPDLEAAMQFYRMPVAAHRVVRETLSPVVYDELWVPASGGYIAVALDGVIVARVRKTKISIVGGPRVELAGYAVRTRTVRSAANPRHGEICPRHFTAMPIAGGCPNCD